MGIQWTLAAGFLYAEIAVAILLMIPYISPKAWNKLFQSGLVKCLGTHGESYFKLITVVLGLVFFDSLREMLKYSAQRSEAKLKHHGHGNVYMQLSIQMFRSQRNVYIAGFSLILWLVIHKLVILIRDQAVLLAVSEAATAQARRAPEASQSPLKKTSEWAQQSNQGRIKVETLAKEAKELATEYEKARKDVDRLTSDRDALKMQAAKASKEFNRLYGDRAKPEQVLEAVSPRPVQCLANQGLVMQRFRDAVLAVRSACGGASEVLCRTTFLIDIDSLGKGYKKTSHRSNLHWARAQSSRHG
ncbi:uncharacterized protein LOC144166677 [Haemaphysalis longicornis]